MNIYFAGAIRGGGGDPKLYKQIINILQRFGDVTTKHLGSPETQKSQLQHLDDRIIYTTDMNELRRTDLLVTEVSTPSLGVGYKMAKAEGFGIPILCLWNKNTKNLLSALVAGNSHVDIIEYKNISDLSNSIKKYIKEKFPFAYAG
jgi:hypothetical protein